MYDINIHVEIEGVWPEFCDYPIVWVFDAIDAAGNRHDLRRYMDIYSLEAIHMACFAHRHTELPFAVRTKEFGTEASVTFASSDDGCGADMPVGVQAIWTNTRGQATDLAPFVADRTLQKAVDEEFQKYAEDRAMYGDYED